ncbi:gliding motility-associated C-terminal domain-containing protein [bacterium SCSIO 12741]|nr:gliding motility-associated C-terminal domain-containing protein [bacterium SCSIO 12741]
MGYQGLDSSVVIEFDTWQNGNLSDPWYDHLAILAKGNNNHSGVNNLAGPIQISPTTTNVEDGQWHHVKISWDADSTRLSVWFDCDFRTSYQGNLIDSVFKDSLVYWGIVASTGGASNLQQFCVYQNILNSYTSILKDTTICGGDSAALDVGGTGYSYKWGPSNGLSSDTVANPKASPAATTKYYVTVTAGCDSILDSVTVNIDPSSFDATITTTKRIYCKSDPPFTLTTADPGGTWQGGSGLNTSNGQFSPGQALFDTNWVTYSSGGLCGDTQTIFLIVDTFPTVQTFVPDTICTGPPNVTFTANPSTGTWSGNPFLSQQGTFLLNFQPPFGNNATVYTVGNHCKTTIRDTFWLAQGNDASFNGPTVKCFNDAPSMLVPVQTGGTWSGNGVNGTGQFNPRIVLPGTHQIVYSFTGGCPDSDTLNILVSKPDDPTFNLKTALCTNSPNDTALTLTSNGSFLGNGLSDFKLGVFNPRNVPAGNYPISHITLDTNGCRDTAAVNVVVTQAADATLLTNGPFCENHNDTVLRSRNPGGTWFGRGITHQIVGRFSPSTAGPGLHNIRYEIAGACGDTGHQQIRIHAKPDAEFTAPDFACNSDQIIQLTPNTPGGEFSGKGVVDSAQGWFNPDGLNVGNHAIRYVVSDSNGCRFRETKFIFVHEYKDPTILNQTHYCLSVESVRLESRANGGTWTIDGVINTTGRFRPRDSGEGVYQVIHSYDGKCAISDTLDINVVGDPEITFDPDLDFTWCNLNYFLGPEDDFAVYYWSNGSRRKEILIQKEGRYTLEVLDEHGCMDTAIINIEKLCDSITLWIPNSFSPNGDEINDEFRIYGQNVLEFHMFIYDRWGQLVFTGHELEAAWDGNHPNGTKCPAGVYTYVIQYAGLKDNFGYEQSETGIIYLIEGQ